jgi:hypothetical protein
VAVGSELLIHENRSASKLRHFPASQFLTIVTIVHRPVSILMIKATGLIFMSLIAFNGRAQTGSEIYLFELKLKKDKIILTHGKNITNHKGYDNQPFFHPDKTVVYFTSADTSGRTDIVAYNYSTNELKKLTNTNEREYSPTVTPDKKFISCIIQRDEGAQDLGKYPVDGGEPIVIIDSLMVGYHAWADNETLILFVLGEPNTLRLFSAADGRDLILAENVGRSLHVIPQSNDVSFVHKISAEQWLIKKIKKQSETFETLTETLEQREDLTWTPDGRIIMSDGRKLFYFHPGERNAWTEIELNSAIPLKGITRISVNKKGDRIALVVNE